MSDKIPYEQMMLAEKVIHLKEVAEKTHLTNITYKYWEKNSISNNQFLEDQVNRMIADAFELGMTDFLLLMGATFKIKLAQLEQQQNIEFVKLIK